MTHEEQAFRRVLKAVAKDDQFWVKRWFNDSKMFTELAQPISEAEKDDYFCRRETFIDFEGDIAYGYTVFKWDGTYKNVPLTPNSKKTFKFKNWQEIFHCHGNKKIDPKEMINIALEKMNILKEFDS